MAVHFNVRKIIRDIVVCFVAETVFIGSILFTNGIVFRQQAEKAGTGQTKENVVSICGIQSGMFMQDMSMMETLNTSMPDMQVGAEDVSKPERHDAQDIGGYIQEPVQHMSWISMENIFTVEDIAEKTMYAKCSLNIRMAPYVNSEKTGILYTGEPVTVNGIADTGWYRLEYDGHDAYVSGKYLSDSKVEDGTDMSTSMPSSTGIVERLGNVSDTWVSKADAMLSRIPRNALDRFISSGYHFYVTDEDIGMTEFGGSIGRVAGVTRYGQYIKVEDRQYAMDEAVIHEFGHFVFDTCGNWGRQDVTDAFNADVGNASLMGISYGLDNVSEFYAEVFQKYIKDGQKTMQVFPNLSAVIQADLGSL